MMQAHSNAALGTLSAAPDARPAQTWTLVMILAFLAVTGLLSYRLTTKLNVPGSPDPQRWGFRDFRDAIYYPAVSFIDGNNPYDEAAYLHTYPVTRRFSYTPLALVVHLPFGLLTFEAAEFVYYLLTLALMLVLARMTLRFCGLAPTSARVFGLAALVLLSRPGHWNLLNGQCTAQLVIGSYLALHYARERPWLAGIGLALSTFKPTFGMPLAFLMFWQGNIRAVVIGLGVAGLVSVGATAALAQAAGGLGALIASLPDMTAGIEANSNLRPTVAPYRIDAVAFIARLIGRSPSVTQEAAVSLGILSLGALGVRRLAAGIADNGVQQLSTCLACLTVLTCTYHQGYDLLLLTLPLTALVTASWAQPSAVPPILRWVLLALLALPAANYLASGTAMHSLGVEGGWWLAVTSLNGAALVTALFLCAALALRPTRREQD